MLPIWYQFVTNRYILSNIYKDIIRLFILSKYRKYWIYWFYFLKSQTFESSGVNL